MHCPPGCLTLPCIDSNGDGTPYLCDENESKTPFPDPKHPLNDNDKDGLPNGWDAMPYGSTVPPFFKNGLIQRDLINPGNGEALRPILKQLGIESVFADGCALPDQFSDYNNDGFLTLGEVFGGIVEEIGDLISSLQADDLATNQLARARQVALTSQVALTLYNGISGRLPALADALSAFIQAGQQLAKAIEARVAGISAALTLAGLSASDYTAQLIIGPDGVASLEITVFDANGDPISTRDVDAALQQISQELSKSIVGDPVDTATGAFVHEVTDLDLGGRGLDLRLSRVYSSRSVRRGAVGRNWSMPMLDTHALILGGSAGQRLCAVQWGDGSTTLFREAPAAVAGDVLFVGIGGEHGLIRNDSEWRDTQPSVCEVSDAIDGLVLRRPDGREYRFCPPSSMAGGGDSLVCWLRQVNDTAGNTITLRRNDRASVYEIIDTLGRVVHLSYDPTTHLLMEIRDWAGRTVNYHHDAERLELVRVDYPATVHLSGSNVSLARPSESYNYWDSPPGFLAQPDAYLNHNLRSIIRNGEAVVEIDYYTAHGDQFDKVSRHTVDGQTTEYAYEVIPQGSDVHSPLATWVARMRHPDGEVERYFHGHGRLYRKEVWNGRFDAGGTLIPGSAVSSGPGQWWTLYEYNDDELPTKIVETTDVSAPAGRRTELVYDSTNVSRLSQGNLLRQVTFPDPQAATLGESELVVEMVYEPVTNRPVRVTDTLGRVSETVYGHQERSYDAVRGLPGLLPWNFLPAAPAQPELWSRGDVNGDGRLGGTFHAVAELRPETAISDPDTPTALVEQPRDRPFAKRVYNTMGELRWIIDERGLKTQLQHAWGAVVKVTVGSPSNALVTEYTRDVLGRVVQVESPDGSVTKFRYDARDQPIEVMHLRKATAPLQGESSLPADGVVIVASRFYDISGRVVGERLPRYGPGASEYSVGWIPQLDSQWAYSSAGNLTTYTVNRSEERLSPGVDDSWAENFLSPATWTCEYDGRGNLVSVQTHTGAEFRLERDARGAVRARDRTLGGNSRGRTLFEYNQYGENVRTQSLIDADTDGQLEESQTHYDGFGRVTARVEPDGVVNRFELDAAGRVLREWREHGGAVIADKRFGYDELDRVRNVRVRNLTIDAAGGVAVGTPEWIETAFGYGLGGDGPLWTVADPTGAGRITRFRYDAFGRHVATLYGSGDAPAVYETLDAAGRVLSRTMRMDSDGRTGEFSPSESVWTYDYDGFGRLRRAVDPTGRLSLMSHTATGAVRAVLDGRGSKTLNLYDTQGNAVLSRVLGLDGMSRVTQSTYGADGEVLSVTDGLGRVTRYEYDLLGRRIARRVGDVDVVNYQYNDIDLLTEVDFGAGNVVSYVYDRARRLTGVSATGLSGSVAQSFQYDGYGNVRKAVSQVAGRPQVTVTRSHSSIGRLVCEELSGLGVGAREFRLSVDAAGDQVELSYPSGASVTWSLDSARRVRQIAHSVEGTLFDVAQPYGLSKARRVNLAGTVRWEYEFDGAGRTRRSEVVQGGGGALAGCTLAYDSNGDIAGRVDSLTSLSETFDYDGLNRLKLWRFDSAGSASRTIQWSRDAADNWTHLADSLVGGGTLSPNSLNQYTQTHLHSSLSYDQRGHEQSRWSPSDAWEWSWDALGRPLGVSRIGAAQVAVQWDHDAFGRLVRRTDASSRTTVYSYLGDALLREDDSALGDAEYVLGPVGESVGWRYSSVRGNSYLHVDPVRNVDAVHSGSGSVSAYRYDPYGFPRAAATGDPVALGSPDSRLFQGLPFDPSLGLSYLGARVYDTSLGRFVSRDPLEELGGLNLYDYAYGNPVRYGDPTGLRGSGHQPTSPLAAGKKLGGSGSGVIVGGTLDALNRYIELNADSLNVSPGTTFDQLNPIQQGKALAFALGDTQDLLGLFENTKHSSILRAATNAPTGAEAALLQAGERALVGAIATLALNAIDMALDIPGTLTTAGLERLGVDEGVAGTVGAGASLAADLINPAKGGMSFILWAGSAARRGHAVTGAGRVVGAAARRLNNPVPSRLARVIPGDVSPTTLGRPESVDVFVTAADDIAGLNPNQIADRLGIPPSRSFTIIEFATPVEGVASPISRSNPGFVGGGLTVGGAREFVIPNSAIPDGSVIRRVN